MFALEYLIGWLDPKDGFASGKSQFSTWFFPIAPQEAFRFSRGIFSVCESTLFLNCCCWQVGEVDGDENIQVLQNRVEHLEILEGLLRELIRDMEEQNDRELELKAAAIAETKRLQQEVERWESTEKSSGFCHPITPEEDANANIGGIRGASGSTSTGLDESEENEGNDEEKSLDSDHNIYEDTPKKPRARKATTIGRGKSNKKPKKSAPKSKRSYQFDKKDYHPYECPVFGCGKRVWFAKKDNPPLNSKGQVCDQQPWCKRFFYNKVSQMRMHLAEKHPNVPKVNYPPGFSK